MTIDILALCIVMSPVWILLYIKYKDMTFKQSAMEKKFISDKLGDMISALLKITDEKKLIENLMTPEAENKLNSVDNIIDRAVKSRYTTNNNSAVVSNIATASVQSQGLTNCIYNGEASKTAGPTYAY